MSFEDQLAERGFIGHESSVSLLNSIARTPEHYQESVFLFTGPVGQGKKRVAKWFGHQISEKSDVNYLEYTAKTKIGDFKEFMSDMGYTPANGICKTYIVDITAPLTDLISNALLKRLEEVIPNCCFIIVCPSDDYLISTISSRSRKIFFERLQNKEIEWIASEQLGFKPAQLPELLSNVGANLSVVEGREWSEIKEAIDYIMEIFGDLDPFMFIEFYELAWYMDGDFDLYLCILQNWAEKYMTDPQWSPRFSSLLKDLFNIVNNHKVPNRVVWLERAFLRFAGWHIPPVVTNYERIP